MFCGESGHTLDKKHRVFVPKRFHGALDRDEAGRLVRRSGVMAVVVDGGEIREGDAIRVTRPPEPHQPLEPV